MVSKPQVKIVKRIERERSEQEAAEKVDPQQTPQTPREAARSLVATVKEWIEEFRQESRDKLPVF